MLWVDKHRPKGLDKLDYNNELSTRLARIAESGDLPHLLFYGPSGAGKKTRILALLRAIYGPSAEKMKIEHRSFKTPTKRTIEITTLGSNHHIEMNPSDAGNYDTFVVQEIIKEIAQYVPIDQTTGKKTFKVVFLSEADHLTKAAQQALRRTMEKYVSSCRIILCCESISKVIDPIRSRCLTIRVPAPTKEDICKIMTKVCKSEGLTPKDKLLANIVNHSGRNLRKALLMLEACRVQQYPFSDDQIVQLPDWERFIALIGNDILRAQTPQRLLEVRAKLYELLANCIPCDVILRSLSKELMKKLDDQLKCGVIQQAAAYDHRLQRGQKPIFHLEAFVAKFMSMYKKYLLEEFGN